MERKSAAMYQAERQSFLYNQIFAQTRCSDWLSYFAGNGIGKDETGSGELRIRNPLEIAASSFVCAPDEWNFRFEVQFCLFFKDEPRRKKLEERIRTNSRHQFCEITMYFSACSSRNKIEICCSYAKIKSSIIPRSLRKCVCETFKFKDTSVEK